MRTETVVLPTADGLALVGDVARPDAPPLGAAVVCHPHPLYGGDRHNQVVTTLWEALTAAGLVTVRFDFRGAGESPGRHDDGRAERLDVQAAVDAASATSPPGSPLLLAGYSFGALVALEVTDERVSGWLAVAPPLRAGAPAPAAAADARPKVLLVPAHDQFCPPPAARAVTEGWAGTDVEDVPMTDHFLGGAHRALAEAAAALAHRLDG